MNTKSLMLILLSLLLGFSLSMLFFNKPDNKESSKIIHKEFVVVRDTVLVIKEGRNTKFNTKPTREISDTSLVMTNPFVVTLDTTIARDSIYLRYLFPENELYMQIASAPDTTYNQYVYIKEAETQESGNTWLERIGIFAFGALTALLLSL